MRLTHKYALIVSDGAPSYFPTKAKAEAALRKYRRSSEKDWYSGFPRGPFFPWAAVVELREISNWEMTSEEYKRRRK